MCNFLKYFSMPAVSTKSIGNTRQGLNALRPPSAPADGMWELHTHLLCDAVAMTRKTLIPLGSNFPLSWRVYTIITVVCGVWTDYVAGWKPRKKLKSRPAVQQETPCWKCHRPIVHNHISHRWPRNLSSAVSLQKILPFPRP